MFLKKRREKERSASDQPKLFSSADQAVDFEGSGSLKLFAANLVKPQRKKRTPEFKKNIQVAKHADKIEKHHKLYRKEAHFDDI